MPSASCRSSKEVAQLLDRCNRVHQALNRGTDSDEEQQPVTRPAVGKAAAAVAAAWNAAAKSAAAGMKSARAASRCVHAIGYARRYYICTAMQRQQHGNCMQASAACFLHCAQRYRLPHTSAHADCSAPSSSAAAAATAVAAAAAARASPSKDSKLLVRAAQRLLRNAQAEAEQVDRALTVAAAAAPQERQPPPAAAARKQSAGVSADRGSPLATVLAQYKEAQAAWAQEKVRPCKPVGGAQ
jgi:hypothetical protein